MGQQRFKPLNLPKETIWFVFVGALAAISHMGGLFFWVHFIHVSPQYANILAFILAFIISFGGHYRLTFTTTQKWYQALWRWFCSAIVGFLLNQLLFTYGLRVLGSQFYLWIWLASTVVVTFFTFLLGKFWAFRYKDK